MLILRRKVGEKIVIGNGIVVVVNRVSGGRVTLGIEAPNDVHIMRGELKPFDEVEVSASTSAPNIVNRIVELAGAPHMHESPRAARLTVGSARSRLAFECFAQDRLDRNDRVLQCGGYRLGLDRRQP